MDEDYAVETGRENDVALIRWISSLSNLLIVCGVCNLLFIK